MAKRLNFPVFSLLAGNLGRRLGRIRLRRQPPSAVSRGRFRILGKRPRLPSVRIRLRDRKIALSQRQSADFRGQSPLLNFPYPIFLAETWFESAETGSIFLPLSTERTSPSGKVLSPRELATRFTDTNSLGAPDPVAFIEA
jgi:hypothetical protein